MVELSDNIYNKNLRQDESKLKLWRYAGLMLTYKCPAECEFCYYHCGPDKGGLMSVDTAIRSWAGLERLAGENARIHITGGEPFLYFERLCEILTEAKKQGLRCAETVETNGFWATDKKTIVERLNILNDLGLDRLKISWDPFHAEYIDADAVKRLARTGSDLLGSERVLVRWENYLQEPVTFCGDTESSRRQHYKAAIGDYPCRFTGRAAGQLGELFAEKTVESIAASVCSSSFLSSKGIHIDPYGNVFSGLCSGITVGNVNDKSPDDIWAAFNPLEMELVGTLFEKGPAGLLAQALEAGYQMSKLYAGKCHLCTQLRQFFFDKSAYKGIISPCECYSHQLRTTECDS